MRVAEVMEMVFPICRDQMCDTEPGKTPEKARADSHCLSHPLWPQSSWLLVQSTPSERQLQCACSDFYSHSQPYKNQWNKKPRESLSHLRNSL